MTGKQLAAPAVLAAGVILTVLVYWAGLDGGFVFDDAPNIVAQPGIRWTEISADAVRALRDSTLLPRRIVANASLAVNHLLGGFEPRGYHAVNIGIHVAVGLALFWLGLAYLRGTRTDGRPGQGGHVPALAAATAVVLFLVHPLNTQAVTYVVQRMTSLAALFCLLAFAAYLTGRAKSTIHEGRWWFVLAGLCWVLALGCKENAVLLPLVLGAYEVCLHRHDWRRWWDGLTPERRTLVVMAATGMVVVLGAAVAAYVGGRPIAFTREWPQRDFNGWERILTQLRVQVFYLGLLLWPAPARLNLDHDFRVSRGLLDPATTLVAGFFWLGVVVGAVVLAARRPRYGFPVLAYLGWHLVEAGPVNLELVFEHRMYLPMTMLALPAAVGLADLKEGRRRPVLIGAAVLALSLAWGTWQRNQVWANAVALHWDTARKSPAKFRPWYNLATLLGANGRIEEALEPAERAVALRPDFSPAHNQLGNVYYFLGRKDDALVEYREAVRLDDGNAEAVYNVGMLLDEQGRLESAIPYYQRFVDIAPPELAATAIMVRRALDSLGVVQR